MRNLLLFSALCLCVSAAGHADSTFYLINNTYALVLPDLSLGPVSGSATGTINIDTTLGQVDSMNVTVNEGGTSYLFTAPYGSLVIDNSYYDEYAYDASGNGDLLQVIFPVSTLVGYTGGDLCSAATQTECDQYATDLNVQDGSAAGVDYAAVTGSLVSTPEPSSLLLLGTGLVATVGAMRRRVFARGA